jgi:hypothetical protein
LTLSSSDHQKSICLYESSDKDECALAFPIKTFSSFCASEHEHDTAGIARMPQQLRAFAISIYFCVPINKTIEFVCKDQLEYSICRAALETLLKHETPTARDFAYSLPLSKPYRMADFSQTLNIDWSSATTDHFSAIKVESAPTRTMSALVEDEEQGESAKDHDNI